MSLVTSQEEFPLLDLFTRLREAGLLLGIDEYQLLLRALNMGFGSTNQEVLVDLCRTLWVKSLDDDKLFNYYFKQVLLPSSSTNPITKDDDENNCRDEETESDFLSTQTDRESEVLDIKSEEEAITNIVPGSILDDSSMPISTELIEVEDEIQAAEVVKMIPSSNEDIGTHFTQSDEYFPINRRQLKQSWRHLRRMVREGIPTELDVEATIENIVQQGILLEPVLVPPRLNRTELLLLIDQKGSMVPFHALSQRLVDTAQQGGRLGRAGSYYFHNCPMQFLYRDSARQQAEAISNILSQLHPERSTALIFSDAGAARGGFNQNRLRLTQEFLAQLRQRVRYLVWLNPLPEPRWVGTTAGEIAGLLPMFEISPWGVERAIDVLRGKPAYVEGWRG